MYLLTGKDEYLRLAHTHTQKPFGRPFYGWGSTASRLETVQGGSLLFTTKFPEFPGTFFINLRMMTGCVKFGSTHPVVLNIGPLN